VSKIPALTPSEVVRRLSREEVLDAATFNREQALALVGLYYGIQKLRIGASNKESAHRRQVDALADPALIRTQKEQLHVVEKQTGRALQEFARAQPLGRWALSLLGVGPIITAGLLAHIDISRAPTAGAVWRFAGLDPTCKWEPGVKRPYNAALKTLCWKLGESFKKIPLDTDFSQPAALYARLYRERKEIEIQRNELGEHAEAARERLAEATRKRFRISPEQREIWAAGKRQAVGLDRMAMRYAVKIFLSHFHQVGREILGLPLVKPWAVEHGGHTHIIAPPCWPMQE
jgi:hypothetical protein